MEYVRILENTLLVAFCVVAFLIILIGRLIIKKDFLEIDIESLSNQILSDQKEFSICKNLNVGLERELKKKKDIISFMSEQNILLENKIGNVNRNVYIESEVLNNNKGCVFTHRFLNSLRNTKGE